MAQRSVCARPAHQISCATLVPSGPRGVETTFPAWRGGFVCASGFAPGRISCLIGLKAKAWRVTAESCAFVRFFLDLSVRPSAATF